MVKSKSQRFDHSQLGFLVLIAIRGVLNVAIVLTHESGLDEIWYQHILINI